MRELDASKRCILLINKADLLTETQRKIWARHFQKAGISFVFWSAAAGPGGAGRGGKARACGVDRPERPCAHEGPGPQAEPRGEAADRCR